MVKCKKALWFLSALFMTFGASQVHADKNQDNQYVQYIDEITHNGITIDKPGVYRFKKNVKVYFKDDDVAAIRVDADNVVIDLNEYVLSQDADTENNVGVLILPGVSNVTVKNGTIDGFSGFGIVSTQWTWALVFKDLLVSNNGWMGGFELPDEIDHVGGILLNGSGDPVWDVTIDNCKVLWCWSEDYDVAVNGLAAVGLIKCSITNSSFSDNWVYSNYSNVGAEFFSVRDINIDRCRFDDIWIDTNNSSGYSHAYGLLFNENSNGWYWGDNQYDSSGSANIRVTNCTANTIGGDATEVGGFAFYRARNIVVENCDSHENYNYLEDYEGDEEYTAVSGFQFYICDNFSVNNCRAYDLYTDDPTWRTVAGFDVAASCFGVFKDCHAAFCRNDNGGGICGGFVVEPFITRDDFTRNVGIVFEDCIAEYNNGSYGEAYPSGGFVFARGDEGKIINCEAIHNYPYGIYVGLANGEGDDDTINSIFKDNIAFSNAYGIVDVTNNHYDEGGRTNLVNAYLGNVARSNGGNPVSDNYYLPDGNSIFNWNLSDGIEPAGTLPTDNISIY